MNNEFPNLNGAQYRHSLNNELRTFYQTGKLLKIILKEYPQPSYGEIIRDEMKESFAVVAYLPKGHNHQDY